MESAIFRVLMKSYKVTPYLTGKAAFKDKNLERVGLATRAQKASPLVLTDRVVN